MGSKVDDNKFSWMIKNFTFLESKVESDVFTIDGCQWRLTAYPKGLNNDDNLSLFLTVANRGLLPSGWKRHTYVSITLVNQLYGCNSYPRDFKKVFDEKTPSSGFGVTFQLPLVALHNKDHGYLKNGQLKVLVQVHVLEAIGGILYESDEEATQPLKKIRQENDDKDKESCEVYGFLVLSSQVEAVKCLFESHPDIASRVRTKCHNLRTSYINIILGLVKTLCQSPQELTDGDLDEACVAASCLAYAGFKVDWLEKKRHQVMDKKSRVQRGEAWLSEIGQQLLILNEECSDIKVLLEKKKAEVAAAKIPFSFNDFL